MARPSNSLLNSKAWWITGAVLFLLFSFIPTQPAQAFEQLPRSLRWELVSQSGTTTHNPAGYPYGVHYANPGDTVEMWITVKNRSTNPRGQVWYGKNSLLPEGPQYPNAHAIGVGTWDPMDHIPDFIDPASFVINNNRLAYYDGLPIHRNQQMTLRWQVKLKDNIPDGTYNLVLSLVREFDEWGYRTTSTGANHRYRSILWQFVVGGEPIPQPSTPPPSSQSPYDGYTAGYIVTDTGTFFTKRIQISLDNPRLKVATDTAVASRLSPTPWPILPFSDFLARNGQVIAAINGCYFWPAEPAYGGNNTFNPMVFNTSLGVMINEHRNAGNLGGLLVFDTSNKPYFFLKTSEFQSVSWFESTYGAKISAAISNVPALIYNGAINYGDGDWDSSMTNIKGIRMGIGVKGSIVFLVVVSGATVPDLAQVMKTLGANYALNLDGGGSAALYYRGEYKQSPGRALPNVIIFAEK